MIPRHTLSVGSLLSPIAQELIFVDGTGYYAVATDVTLATISRTGVFDLLSTNLANKNRRVQNAVRMIKMGCVLRLLQEKIGNNINEFLPIDRLVLLLLMIHEVPRAHIDPTVSL